MCTTTTVEWRHILTSRIRNLNADETWVWLRHSTNGLLCYKFVGIGATTVGRGHRFHNLERQQLVVLDPSLCGPYKPASTLAATYVWIWRWYCLSDRFKELAADTFFLPYIFWPGSSTNDGGISRSSSQISGERPSWYSPCSRKPSFTTGCNTRTIAPTSLDNNAEERVRL